MRKLEIIETTDLEYIKLAYSESSNNLNAIAGMMEKALNLKILLLRKNLFSLILCYENKIYFGK